MIHEAGIIDKVSYTFVSEYKNFITPLVIELWCETNCVGHWRIVSDDDLITTNFENDIDAMFFKLSDFKIIDR